VKSQTIETRASAGRILSTSIFRPCGRKLLAKGHLLNVDDVRLLESEGLAHVSVTELEDGEIGEDDAVLQAAREMSCGSMEIRMAAGGRANLIVTENSCAVVDDEVLRQINCVSSVVIATVPNFSFARAGSRVATVKSAPFAIPRAHLEAVIDMLRDRGPILQARPIRNPSIAVLYCDPVHGDRARALFEPIMRQRLDHFGLAPSFAVASVEDERQVARNLEHLLRTKPSITLIASTTAPAGPDDVIGRAMAQIGCHIERFLAPVEPGSLFLLGYKDEIPVISAPGCFRSAKRNVVDLVLPPMLARYRVSSTEVGCLGHGGLLA